MKGKTRCYKLDEAPEDRCSLDRHLIYLTEKRWGLDVTEESLVGISQNKEHEQGHRDEKVSYTSLYSSVPGAILDTSYDK